jgi:hypothetical protein
MWFFSSSQIFRWDRFGAECGGDTDLLGGLVNASVGLKLLALPPQRAPGRSLEDDAGVRLGWTSRRPKGESEAVGLLRLRVDAIASRASS